VCTILLEPTRNPKNHTMLLKNSEINMSCIKVKLTTKYTWLYIIIMIIKTFINESAY